MSNPSHSPNTGHTLPATTISLYCHIFLREPWSWQSSHDIDLPEHHLLVEVYTSKEAKPPELGGQAIYLHTVQQEFPIPEMNPVEARLACIDKEHKELRFQYARRVDQLKEQREKILSLPSPGEGISSTETNDGGPSF